MCTQPELTLRRDTKETDISFLTREMLIKKKTNDLFFVCVCFQNLLFLMLYNIPCKEGRNEYPGRCKSEFRAESYQVNIHAHLNVHTSQISCFLPFGLVKSLFFCRLANLRTFFEIAHCFLMCWIKSLFLNKSYVLNFFANVHKLLQINSM